MVLTLVMLLAELLVLAAAVLVGVLVVMIQQELQTQVAEAEAVSHLTQKAVLAGLVVLSLKNPQ